jgi:PAS domain S-box-containing protein
MELIYSNQSHPLDRLFPFHITFDEEGNIIHCGISIKKIFGELQGNNFFSHFTIVRPYNESWNFDKISSELEAAFFIKFEDRDIILRGQFIPDNNQHEITFFGSFWINSIETLEKEKLLISDFAIHDPTYDFIHIIKQLEIQGDELKQLFRRIKEKTSQLEISESRYRNLLDNASEMLYQINMKGDILYANPKFIDRIKFQNNQYSTSNIIDYVDAEKKQEYLEKIELLNASQLNSVYFETILLSEDNKKIWLGQSIQRIDTEGTDEFMVFAIDLTGQKEQEEAVRHSNKQLQLLSLLINQTSDAIHVTDEEGNILYINEKESIRLNIPFEQSTNYNIKKIDLRFAEKGSWENFLTQLKKHNTITFEQPCLMRGESNYSIAEIISQLTIIDGRSYIVSNIRDISIRKNAENQLLETKQQLESILLEMTDVVYTASFPEYQLTFVTPSVDQMFGYSSGFWIGRENWWYTLLLEEDYAIVDELLQQLLKTGKFEKIHRIKTSTNEIKWIRHKGKIIYDEKSQPLRMDCHITDITALHLTEENLKTEIRLQEVLIDIAFLYINSELENEEETIHASLRQLGKFLSADRAYIFDYNFERNKGSIVYEWCNEGVSSRMQNLRSLSLQGFEGIVNFHQQGENFLLKDLRQLETREQQKIIKTFGDGRLRSLITVPMRIGDKLLGFIGFDSITQYHHYTSSEIKLLGLFSFMLINIRSRQSWEKQLKIQEEKFRNIIANMNLGLLEVDNDDNILFANQSMIEMSGYSLTELKGKKAASTFIIEKKQEIITQKQGLRKKGISDSYEVEVTNKQGENRVWLVSGAPNYDDKGELIGTIGIHLDITQQKKLERELAESKSFAETASKAKELFLANMSHEIRTPLNVIIGMIRQLGKENLKGKEMFYLRQADSSAKHLLAIVNHILDIAKIESGEMAIKSEAFSLNALCNNIYSVMFSAAGDKNLDFTIKYNDELSPVLIGDEVRIRQILFNIVGNAIKFTDTGYINIDVFAKDISTEYQDITISITDSGIGMSQDYINRIFDKFSQEEASSRRKFEGTGLGMAISRDLIRLMGGHLNVTSKKGEGTKISIQLQLKKGNSDELIHSDLDWDKEDFADKHVLLVEDNEVNRFIALQSLSILHCKVDEAGNGIEALDKIKCHNYDLILMDIQMPGMDGVETTEQIRQTLKLNIPIIALTANAFKHDIDLYLSKGMNDYIIKPFDEREFLNKVANYFQKNYRIIHEDQVEATHHKKKLIDIGILEQMSRGDASFVAKMITIFKKSADDSRLKLEESLLSKDTNTIKKIAHKIKPSIVQLNAVNILEDIIYLDKMEVTKLDHPTEVIIQNVIRGLNDIVSELNDIHS